MPKLDTEAPAGIAMGGIIEVVPHDASDAGGKPQTV